jgi:D-lactate dehydrogenase
MNDQRRLQLLQGRLATLPGLDEQAFGRISDQLDRLTNQFGHDDRGRLKVIFFDAKSYDTQSFTARNNEQFALHFLPARLNSETVVAAKDFKAVCLFVNDTCDATVVGQLAAQGVELLALRCAGYNNVDLAACERHGIDVVRVPAYSPYAVAEHTVALMLTLNRRVHHAYARNRTGNFVLEGLTGFDMHGKVAGVVGSGKIGQCLIDILLGFGCRVLAFDKFPNPRLADREGVRYVELEELLRQSDIISLHVPLFPETHHMIDEKAIASMKPGVMLINTSRGGLIDTRALINGLKSGHIGSAGLDVYEEEAGIFFEDLSAKVLNDDVLARLLTFNNVVVTSHQAYLTHEALANIADSTLGNLREFAEGRRGGDLTNAVVAPTLP